MKFIAMMTFLVSFAFASIDINSADSNSLVELKGIGAKKADAIVKYRDEHGCFSSVDELVKVKGIGQKFLEKNAANLEAKNCK